MWAAKFEQLRARGVDEVLLIDDAEPTENRHRIDAEHDPSADWRPGLRLLDDLARDAELPKTCRGRKTRDATADDQDPRNRRPHS